MILVDHNEADGVLKGKVNDRVTEILDHHEDQHAHKGVQKKVIMFNEKSGKPEAASACSVVAHEYLQTALGRGLLKKDGGVVAAMLLAVVIIDSQDLAEASPEDKANVAALKADIPDVDSREDLQFKVLQDKKVNPAFWAAQTLEQNLLYDFKQFEAGGLTCGISSTFISLDVLIEKLKDPEQASAIREYIKDPDHPDPDAEAQSNVFMIMLKKAPDMFLAVASLTPDARAFSRNFLLEKESKAVELLQLTRVDAADDTPASEADGWRPEPVSELDYYNQANHHASRKQVGPACQDMLAAFCKSRKCENGKVVPVERR